MSENPEGSAPASALLAELRVALTRLHLLAGEPSTRTIAVGLNRALSHTTVNAVLKCQKTPRWGQLELVVQALEGRVDEFHGRWVAIRDAEQATAQSPVHYAAVKQDRDAATGEIRVLEDHASLRYDEGTYTLTQKRLIANIGGTSINGYPVRIHVDRFPHFEKLSHIYHLQYPLRRNDLGFAAWYDLRREVPLTWGGAATTSSTIELWLQFGSATEGKGLAPGAKTWIEYEYQVPQSQWGNWFQRAIRHRTDEVSVVLDFPADLIDGPDGVTLSSSSPASPRPGSYLPSNIPVAYEKKGARSFYSWQVRSPALLAKFRTEWRFSFWPTAQLQHVGVLQYSDSDCPLTKVASPINFDEQGGPRSAENIARRLTAVANQVAKVHRFTNGMGLAAPQVGIDKEVVLLRDGDGVDTFLVNPKIAAKSGRSLGTEGCLSFFDVRGEFPRYETVEVAFRTLDGAKKRRPFTGREARDVAHEIDHLNGKVFVDRMHLRDRIFLAPSLRKPT